MKIEKRYTYYNGTTIYAIYFRSVKIMYYNLNFTGTVQIILLKN